MMNVGSWIVSAASGWQNETRPSRKPVIYPPDCRGECIYVLCKKGDKKQGKTNMPKVRYGRGTGQNRRP